MTKYILALHQEERGLQRRHHIFEEMSKLMRWKEKARRKEKGKCTIHESRYAQSRNICKNRLKNESEIDFKKK